MEYPYIKNITHEKVQSLAGLVNAEDGQIVSKTLAQNEAVSVTLFAFAKGEEISTHDSTGDAMVTVLEGTDSSPYPFIPKQAYRRNPCMIFILFSAICLFFIL